MASVELISAYISLVPSMKGVGATVNKQLGGVNITPAATKLGSQLTTGLGKSLKANVKDALTRPVTTALENASKATHDLGRAERELSRARASNQSAQAKVVRAEEKLTALRDSGAASSGDLKVAEAELNQAKVVLADTNIKVGNAEDSLTKAKESASEATSKYGAALKQANTTSGKLALALPAIQASMVSVGQSWQAAGKRISDVGSGLTSKITKPALGAATVVGGLVSALGFKRLVGIDTARGQFKGLGHDADQVMKQVDAGVTNTALSMAEGASLAVGILATGNLPLEQLEGQLKRVANVSAAYGVDASQAGYLLNNVLTKNKVTYGDLSQMVQNQIPIISMLADYYGVAGDEIEKMASDGEISIEDFNKVLDQNAGAAAEEYANTWKGVTSNILSNIGRIGAQVLDTVFPQLKEQAQGFLETLRGDEIKQFAADLGVRLGEAFTKVIEVVKSAVAWWNNLSPGMQKTIGIAAGVVVAIGPVVSILGSIVSGVGTLITVGGAVIKVVQLAAGAFKIFNAVLMANPIGLIITAIGALVAATIWFFTQTELGRELWSKFMTFLSDAWTNISSFLSETWAKITGWFTDFTSGISNVWNSTWSAVTGAVQSAIQFVQKVIQVGILAAQIMWQTVWGAVRNFFTNVWNAIVSAATGFMNSVKNTFTSVTNFIGSIPSKIMGFFRGIGTWLLDSGKALIQGFINGIKSAFEGAKKIVSDGLGAIRNLFPFSPAKEGPFSGRGWVAYSGMSLGQTFTESVADSLHDGRKDIHDELGGIRREFDGLDAGFNAGFRLSSASPDAGLYGSSTSGYVVIKDVNDELVGRMRVEADGRISGASSAGSRQSLANVLGVH